MSMDGRLHCDPPKPFEYDGCTLFPDGDWGEPCCYQHDLDYWRGGTYRERLESDRRLRKCVAGQGKWYHPPIAWIMYVGVRIFGAFYWPFPWRWGYGYKWPQCKPSWD